MQRGKDKKLEEQPAVEGVKVGSTLILSTEDVMQMHR